jgi:hypothetical protein
VPGTEGTGSNPRMTRLAHFRISEELYERARQAAEADRRTLSNWLAVLVERTLKDESRTEAGQPAP